MIDLKEVITKYPECLGSAAKFRSYMLDLYPDPADQARIKVLADVLSCGVVDEIKKGKSDPISLSRYRKVVEEKCGYSPRLIEESIIRWTNAFEVKPVEQPAKISPAKPAELDIGETIHVHKFKDTVVNPTCRDRGYTLHQCACGYEHKDSFTPVGQHRFEQVDEIKPTCFEEGRQDFLCSVCAEYKSEPIPKVPHKYGKWEIVNAVTCTMDGARERHCKYCAASQQEIIPALGHKWSEWTTQSFATCTEDGKSVRQCDHCKEVEEKVLPAIGHDFSEWVPSQSQEGIHERYCKNCGELQFKLNSEVFKEREIGKKLEAIEKEQKHVSETIWSKRRPDVPNGSSIGAGFGGFLGCGFFSALAIIGALDTFNDSILPQQQVRFFGVSELICGVLFGLMGILSLVLAIKPNTIENIKLHKYKKREKELEKEKDELKKQIAEL